MENLIRWCINHITLKMLEDDDILLQLEMLFLFIF